MINRPISPHLQVYQPQLTSVLSILHRMTGVVLGLGIPFLVYWIWTISQGPAEYASGREFFGSLIGRTLLFGWTFCFFYHLNNGVRHLFWDIGRGFELVDVYRSGWLVVAAAVVMTLATWIFAYAGRGAM